MQKSLEIYYVCKCDSIDIILVAHKCTFSMSPESQWMGRIAADAGETWLGTREPSNVRFLPLTGRTHLNFILISTHERNFMYIISLDVSSMFNQPTKLIKYLQMFLDVDCRDLKYTYSPSKEIDTAAQRLEHKLRG